MQSATKNKVVIPPSLYGRKTLNTGHKWSLFKIVYGWNEFAPSGTNPYRWIKK